MIDERRLKQTLLDLIAIDSVSLKERAMADEITMRLQKIGIAVCEDGSATVTGGTAGNLIATIPGNKDHPSILFSAHMDTVASEQAKKAFEKDGCLYSNGPTILGADDAAGIAIMLELAQLVSDGDNVCHGDITLLFTIGEEIGLVGSRALKKEDLQADFAYTLDDCGAAGGVTCYAPGHVRINVTLKGKSAHAGVEPENGVDAIRIFAHAVDHMKLGRIDYETTANIGKMEGGTAMNIVCDKVEVLAEARSLTREKLEQQLVHMRQCFEDASKRFGGEVEFQQDLLYQAIKFDSEEPIVQRTKRAAEAVGAIFYCKSSGGGSDTNVLNGLGVPTVTLSVGYEKMHTKEEFLVLNEFYKAAQMAWYLAIA